MSALHITRVLAVSPERVWRAFTDPAVLAGWYWPPRFATTVETDLRVGGRYRIDGPGAAMAVTGEYVSVDPPSRLMFTWRWDGDVEETLVTLELAPAGHGTELTLVHERFSDDASRDNHTKGWSDCLDRLADTADAVGKANRADTVGKANRADTVGKANRADTVGEANRADTDQPAGPSAR